MSKRWSLTITTCLLLLFLSSAAPIDQLSVDELHDLSYTLLDSDLDSAMAMADRALKKSEDDGYHWGVGNSYFIKAYIADEQGKATQAIVYNLKGIKVLDPLNNEQAKKAQSMMNINVAIILQDFSKYNQALVFLDQAEQISWEYEFMTRLMKIYHTRSSVLQDQERYEEAMEAALTSLDLARREQDEYVLINSRNMLGIIAMETEQYEVASEYFQSIVDHQYEELDELKYKGRGYHNLARIHRLQSHFEGSIAAYRLAAGCWKSYEDTDELFTSLKDLTEVYHLNGDPELAIRTGEEALRLYPQLQAKGQAYDLFATLSAIHYEMDDLETSVRYLTRYKAENDLFLSERSLILKQQNQFQMELVLAGYYQEITSKERLQQLTHTIWILAIFILLATAITRYVALRKKRSLERELRQFL